MMKYRTERKKWRWVNYLLITVLIAIILPSSHVEAGSTITVKTKVQYYKGQPYIHLTGGKKSVTDKLNKTFKLHAVKAARLDKEEKKSNKNYFYITMASVKYNAKEKLSVVYEDHVYTGGAHGMDATKSYNYDLRTGKELKLSEYVIDDTQMEKVEKSISNSLLAMYNAGDSIFEENIYDFELDQTSQFFLYDEGIVIRFHPYEVAPYAKGFVDIKVPFSKFTQ